MDNTSGRYQITEGTDVYGSDGEKVGSIVAVRPNYVVVEKGFFFPTDYYIPVSAVSGVQDGGVYLNVTKDAALNQGWDAIPADYESETVVTTTTTDTGYATGRTVDATDAIGTTAGAAAGLAGAGAAAVDETTVVSGETTGRVREEPFQHGAQPGHTGHRVEEDRIAVPVHEEELTATKTARELGEVRIEKDVVAEERVLNVPVTEERVRVERRAVDRPAGAADAAFEDEVIEVPVYGEDVQLQKQVRVAEEVEIGKEAVQRTEQVRGTVRREEVEVVGDVVETDTVRTRDVNVTGDVIEGQGPGGRTEGGSASY